ncbi:MAG TPA: shikimate kinase [Candidatus Blautia avistercoris]|mgnify:CR=1 FL=1|nr:shikimate kinase [Blautia sp. An249]OUO79100.1 hypothetical protein B5F53_08470 [Blautia sp. An249]HIY18986.1 shikimate kinase [Candidatus Blautia avistercoris]
MKKLDFNLVLIGFMGSGKTTVAEYLHGLLEMEVVEMDQVISLRQQMSIPEIFGKYGEEYFRDLETELLKELQEKTNVVISCGGGVPLREQNVQEMKKNGTVIWLTASAETIYERVKEDQNRPLLKDRMSVEGIARLMESRREKYESASDILIATDGKTIEQIGKEILENL